MYSMVRKGSAPKNTLIRSRWPVEASPEDFQDTEWGWDEYKKMLRVVYPNKS